jgi:hypothetical protein
MLKVLKRLVVNLQKIKENKYSLTLPTANIYQKTNSGFLVAGPKLWNK